MFCGVVGRAGFGGGFSTLDATEESENAVFMRPRGTCIDVLKFSRWFESVVCVCYFVRVREPVSIVVRCGIGMFAYLSSYEPVSFPLVI